MTSPAVFRPSSPESGSSNDLAIVVVSCDAYADLWPVFFALWRRHWPDCPYPVYLVSNVRRCEEPGVVGVDVGPDRTWAQNLRTALDRIGHERVLLLLEDFLLEARVDTARVRALARTASEADAHVLRLVANPGPSRPAAIGPEIGTLDTADRWRVSTQAAVWRTATLRALLRPRYTAWDFEWLGTRLSSAVFPDGFYGVYDPALVYRHGVERGRWLPHGLAICAAAGVPVDLAARPSMTARQLWGRRWGQARATLGRLLPERWHPRGVPDASPSDVAAARAEVAQRAAA